MTKTKKPNTTQARTAIVRGPIHEAPAPPPSFHPNGAGRGRGPHVLHMQGVLAQSVAGELRGAERFAEDFGDKASPEALASLLEDAAKWHAERVRAKSWLAYASEGGRGAWSAAFEGLERFRKLFE